MTRALLAIAVLATASSVRADDGGVAASTEVVAAHVMPSVVRLADMVRGEQVAHGSGFFVADDLIVTNHHVIEDVAGDLVAVLSDGKELKVLGKLADDEARDLALVRVASKGHPVLTLAPPGEVHVGQRVIAVGSPLGFDQTVSAGIVSAVREAYPAELVKLEAELGKKQGPLVQHTAPIAPGSSGGPLLDDQGRVVGVNHSTFRAGEINFAAHVDALRFVLAHAKLDASPDRVGPNVRLNLYISGGAVVALVLAWFIATRVARRRARRS